MSKHEKEKRIGKKMLAWSWTLVGGRPLPVDCESVQGEAVPP
jgi:hypothetical protein